MALLNATCPNCGGEPVLREFSNDFICESCGATLSPDDNIALSNNRKKQEAKFNYYEREDGLLSIHVNSRVKTIRDVINILKREYFAIKDVYELVIANNNLVDLEDIQEFENLEYLDLSKNNLETINSSSIEYFIIRIYRSKIFSLNLSGNKNLDYNFLNELIIERELPNDSWNYINIPEIEKLIKHYKRQVKNANRMWERSESSNSLQNKYKNYNEYLLAETTIQSSENAIYNTFRNILISKKELLRNCFTLVIDKNPFDYGIKDYFELNDNTFYKYVNYPPEEKVIIEALGYRTYFDFNILFEKYKSLALKEKRNNYIGNLFLVPLGATVSGSVAGAIIGFIIGFVSCYYKVASDKDPSFAEPFQNIFSGAFIGAVISMILGLIYAINDKK